MNIATLRACFQSDNFRLRLHGAMVSAAKKKFPAYVKNRDGKPFIRVEHFRPCDKRSGFQFIDSNGKIIPQKTVYAFLSGNAS